MEPRQKQDTIKLDSGQEFSLARLGIFMLLGRYPYRVGFRKRWGQCLLLCVTSFKQGVAWVGVMHVAIRGTASLSQPKTRPRRGPSKVLELGAATGGQLRGWGWADGPAGGVRLGMAYSGTSRN